MKPRQLVARARSERARSQLQLVVRIARRQIAQRYRESLFGGLWAVLNPLLLLVIYWFVFSEVFDSRWTGPGSDRPYALIIFSGLVLFNMYAEIVNGSTFMVQSNALLIKRTTVSAKVLPLAASLAALFTFALSLIPFFVIFAVLEREPPPWTAILLPIVVLPLVAMSTGIGMVLASASAYFRDLQQVVPLLNTAVLFLSPIFFASDALPASMRPISERFTPLGAALVTSKRVLFLGELPSPQAFGLYCVGSFLVFGFGWWVYSHASRGFADVV